MPAGEDVLALKLRFRVRPGTTASSTAIRFLDGARGLGQPVSNSITMDAKAITPEQAASFIFMEGRVTVAPEITIFRGDSNGDGLLTIADAIFTLQYLFLGGEAPSCPSAADFDANGRIEMFDAIETLSNLFLGGRSWPSFAFPSGVAGPTDCPPLDASN
jgi:hypothetical protein